MYKLFLFSLFLFLGGCKEEYPTYASFEYQKKIPLSCLHYMILDTKDKQVLKQALNIPDNPTCDTRVELTKYYVGKCNNPVVKSVGGDFNGYVRVEIKKSFKVYYKVQSDFKNDVDAAFNRVVKQLKIDLNQ